MTFWLGGWVMGETFAIGAIFRSDKPVFANAFLLFWLLGWTVGALYVIYTILWQLIGRELIIVEKGLMTIGKSVKGIGRKKSYEIKSIKKLDVNPIQGVGIWHANYNRNMFGMRNGKIKFDYGMKTIKFANDVDEAEARMIFEKLKNNTNFNEENFV